jgi:hypothetical protein
MLDPITLNLIHELNVKDAFAALSRPLGVTRSTIECVETLIEQLSMHRDGMKTIGKQDERYFVNEVPAEDMAVYLAELKGLVAWAQMHCEEVPAIAESDLSTEARRLGHALGRSFLDTINAARGRGWLLLSDDLYFRQLAKQLNVDGVWMQPVLEFAFESGALTEGVYHDAVIKLALMNHTFTSLNANNLLHATEQDGWRVTARIKKLLEIAAGPMVEMNSALRVLASYFHDLLDSRAPAKARRRIFAATLEAFEKNQIDAAQDIHRALDRLAEFAFEKKSHAHSRRRREWKTHIDAWLSRCRHGQKRTMS